MITKLPRVTAIVVGTNEKEWLAASLGSLSGNSYDSLDIIFIDNNSEDGSRQYVESNFPQIKVIQNPTNLGFAGANNIGIRYALNNESDYIFLVNPDTISPDNLILGLVEFMEMNNEFGIIGPIQRDYHNINELNRWSVEALENQDKSVFHKWDSRNKNTQKNIYRNNTALNIIEHAYVQGSAIFFRKEVFEKTGLFDEIFHTYYEETDLCRKARWTGYRIGVILDIHIQHFGGGGSTNRPAYTNYYFTRNKYIYLITDPEYNFQEVTSISTRWLLNDIKNIFVNKRRHFKDYLQLPKIIFWIISHATTMTKIRKANYTLYDSVIRTGTHTIS